MKGEIGATRRNTYNAEESVKNLEQSKKKQDLLIDSMNEEIKRLNEQKTLYQAQLISQREETAAARETLEQANGEIKQVILAKKNLLEDWKKSLQAMQRRDKALQSMRDLIKEKNEAIMRIESETIGVKKETRAEHDESERLHEKRAKFMQESKFLDMKMEELMAGKKKLLEQQRMLKMSLNSTEEESARMSIEKSNAEDKKGTLEKSVMALHTRTKLLRDDIIHHASQQKTFEKSSANLVKQTKQAYQGISEKEIAIEEIANEISRVKIDVLNATQQNEILQQKLKQLQDEQDEKDKEVSTFENDIKDRDIKITMKQHKVDRLNRQLGELKKNGMDENTGPLGIEKSNLMKMNLEKEDEISNIQKDWIGNQTKLVSKQIRHNDVTTLRDELKTKKVILEQKKMRLNQNFEQQEKEIRQLQVAYTNLEGEMNKLNDQYSNNTDSSQKLTNENFNLENEFVQKLKELENESIKLENNIQNLRDEKADILAEIVEAERQILLWERKIQLENEMQDTLDPNIGQKEIIAMKKEIHRMELRYERARKTQEGLIKGMERAVFKRETIQMKYLPKVEKKNAQDKTSMGKLSTQIKNLKQTLKHTTESSIQLDSTIEQKIKELEQVNEEIEKSRGEIDNNEKDTQ